MEQIIRFFIFLTLTVQLASADTHSLDYYATGVTPGTTAPEFTIVGLVDGLEGGYYDSNSKKVILTGTWIKDNDDYEHWNAQLQRAQSHEAIFKYEVSYLMKLFNQTSGMHIFQWMTGCELDDDGSKRGYSQYAYDGEDFLTLDLNTVTWTAANDKAVIVKHDWESTSEAMDQKIFLANNCIKRLQKYVDYGNATLEGKVAPKVYLFQKDSSSHVVCRATGFYPKTVIIYWQKNGEDLHEDVDLRETLPNMDDTFQRSSVLTVSPEELDKHNYTCVVKHSSLKKEIVLHVVNHRVSAGGLIGIIISAAVTVLLVTIGVFLWKKKKPVSRPTPSADQRYSRCMEMSCL